MEAETEAKIAQRVLSEITRAPYGLTPPRQGHLGTKPKWYVTLIEGSYYERTAHAFTSWADDYGRVWVESDHLGSPTSWAEEEYGEKGAVRVMDIDYRDLSLEQIQTRLKTFPKLYDRIETYKQTAAEISHKSGTPIEMVFDARADMGWFFFRAWIDPKVGEFEDGLRKAVAAMKWVYDLTENDHYRARLDP